MSHDNNFPPTTEAEQRFPGIFTTGGQMPINSGDTLIQLIRYQNGNLVTYNMEDIERIEPYKTKKGGRIFFKNKTQDFYYNIWPLRILIDSLPTQ